MRIVPSTTKVMLAALVAMLGFGMVSAQDVTETKGKMGLLEGRRYMVAFPQVWASPTEKPLPQPMQLFISSRSKAKVKIETPAAINSAADVNREYTIQPNQVLRVSIPTPAYMNQESEAREGFGIRVTADKPISVSTYQAWMGNGELARHLPVEAWGKNYYSMNFYQDRYGASGGYKYRPSQILIIADKDNTVVSYTPTWDTEGGRETPSIRKGQTGTVTLEKGETYLIKAKIDENYNKDFTSDLTGTWIRASRPVGVVSGHTKVGIMRYPDVLPPTGMFAAEAHFVRNNVHDAMLPIEMAGTEFVTIPCMYTPTRVVGQSSAEFGIDDDKGDVLRFVATEDNTTISAMRTDGSGFMPIKKLNRGETWLETSWQWSTLWKADKPVLMGHYGKSYAKILPPSMGKNGDNTQGHPTVESGMPMLQYVPSVDRWVNYAVFHSPEGMDNFFNIVFKMEEVGKIKIDGRSLNSAFGGAMRPIAGTPYAVIRTNIGQGDHVVESESESIKWAAWTYGSLDGLQQGRAYGTPVAIDLAIPCDDSLKVTETIVCGDIDAVGTILPENSPCGSIFAVYAEDLQNYELIEDENFNSGDQTINFQLNVLDKTKDAKAVVRVVSRSGNYVEKTYTYTADKLAFDPAKLDFGTIPFNTPVCKEITFTNLRTDAPLNIKDIRAKYYPEVYSFAPKSGVIPPGGSMKIQVCAVITDVREKLDTVIAQLDCFEMPTTELRVRGEEPTIYVEDETWVNIPASSPGLEKPVDIINGGKVDIIITGYDETLLDGVADANDPGTFFNPRNLKEVMPLTLKAGERHTFFVTYSPKGDATTQHIVNVPFYSNAKKVDSIAVLKGNGVMVNTLANIDKWNVRVLDNVQAAQNITRYDNVATFSNDGAQPITFEQPFIRGTDAASFKIENTGNTGGFPIQLVGGGAQRERNITVSFNPTEIANRGAERDDYTAELVFPTDENGTKGEIVVNLEAVAWQPQVKGIGHDFGQFQVGDAQAVIQLPITNEHYQDIANPTTGDAKGTRNVVITDIRIVGQANNFVIENAPTLASPWILAPGEQQLLSVRFNPAVSGQFTANYEIITQPADMTNGAAPYTPVYELKAEVLGGDFAVEGASGEQYVYNAKELIVKVRHTEARDRSYTISAPAGADASRFEIIEPSNYNLIVAPGAEGIIRVRFIPDYVTKMSNGQTRQWLDTKGNAQGVNWRDGEFSATIDVTDDVNGKVQTATVTGNGLYLETTNLVNDYKVEVGKPITVYVELEGTPEQINSVGLKEMRVRISYDPKLIKPRTKITDIVTTGMLAEGWTILKVDQVNNNMIEIDLAGNTTLVNDGRKFFGVVFDSYLATGADKNNPYTSPVNIYSYPVDFDNSDGVGTSQLYCVIRDIPGSVEVLQNCAKGMRLVSISSTNFSVKPIAPNPVSGTAIINYSIGLDGNTRIVLYNNMGQRVMDIVDEEQATGTYELTIDVSTLPAGTYYYQVISGPFTSEPQVLTVVH